MWSLRFGLFRWYQSSGFSAPLYLLVKIKVSGFSCLNPDTFLGGFNKYLCPGKNIQTKKLNYHATRGQQPWQSWALKYKGRSFFMPCDRPGTYPRCPPPLTQWLLEMGTRGPCDLERKKQFKMMDWWDGPFFTLVALPTLKTTLKSQQSEVHIESDLY